MKLKLQLILFFAFSSICLIIMQGFFSLYQTKHKLKDDAKATLQATAQQVNQALAELDNNIYLTKKQSYDNYDHILFNEVQGALSIINYYYTQAKSAKLTEEEAKKNALNVLRTLRYDQDQYFWIDDVNYTLLLFPRDPSREGENRKDWKDITGTKMVAHMVNGAKKNGQALLEYYTYRLEKKEVALKRSYVRLFEPWGWIVGTGTYTEDMNKKIENNATALRAAFQKQLEEKSIEGSIGILDSKGSVIFYARNGRISSLFPLIDQKTKEPLKQKILNTKNGFFEYTLLDPTSNKSQERIAYVKYNTVKGYYILVSKNKDFVFSSVNTISKALYKDFALWGLSLLFVTAYFLTLRDKAGMLDHLTGLYNREKIKALLDQKIRAKEKGNLKGDLSLLLLDIDEFSAINSRYGTQFGDVILQKIAGLMRSYNDVAYISRTKGDDFFIILKETNWKKSCHIAHRLYNSLNNKTINIDGILIKIRLNGILIKWNPLVEDSGNVISLLEKSLTSLEDNAVQKNLHIFEDLKMLISNKNNLSEEKNIILEILEKDQIAPFFQPIYNITDDKIEKYEVLMRIKQGEEFLPPFQYILMAEKHNLIQEMDQAVIHKALEYKKSTKSPMHLSINISGKEMEESFLNKIWDWVKMYNIDPREITLELTETSAIENIDEVSQLISKFKQKGFLFAIDDFGTGFSGIQYLRDLPVDFVKIDGSFIKNMDHDHKNYYIVKSLTSMAKAFDMKVVAEFVENETIFNLLKDIEIEYAQGYFIGKPNPSFIIRVPL